MKLLIYRDRETNEIVDYNTLLPELKVDKLQEFNELHHRVAEIVEIEENSLCYYFYKLKEISKQDYWERLKNIEHDIENISSNITDELELLRDLCEE